MDTPPKPATSEANSTEHDLPVLLVLGLTGAGKTTFINHIAQTNLPVGGEMSACTTTTQTVKASIAGVEFLLVDTPGFDDPEKSDADVLYDLTEWIRNNLHSHRKVTGALYLHSVLTEKMYGSSTRNLLLFSKLVGSNSMKNVGLVTTRWDVVDRSVGLHREAQLSAKPWNHMLKKGARKYRVRNDYESCYTVVRTLLEAQPSFLKIQVEMGEEMKPLSRTEAGEHVCLELLSRIDTEKMFIKELERQINDTSNDETDREDFRKELNEAKAKLKKFEADLDMIKKVPTWGEWAWTNVKTHGPSLAGQVALQAVLGRSRGMAVTAMQGQVAAVMTENTVLKASMATAQAAVVEAAAKVAASSGGAAVGGRFAQGVGAGSTFWVLEKTWPVVKEVGLMAGRMALNL